MSESTAQPRWDSVVDYAQKRIQTLTQTCISSGASTDQIRAAQAAIEELSLLINLPHHASLQLKQQQRTTARGGY